MYYISDYKKRAVNTIIPYLIDFPQIVKIIETSADRYQAIEDCLWNIANNFRVDDARGVFLQALAHNEVVDITYTDKVQDAFTYGTDKPLFQAYGTGHYYSQASYISGIKKDVSDDKLIRAIKAKIIQNNTNGTIEDFIESLKLYFNATNVKIYESNPLNVSIMLRGKNLELLSSGNYDVVKKMLPICVALKDFFVDSYGFDIFQYDEGSSYGDSRYPVLIGDSTDIYSYISQSIALTNQYEEYITPNYTKFDTGMYCVIAGNYQNVEDGAVLFSTNDGTNSLSLKISGEKFVVDYNGEITESDIIAGNNDRFTIILYNSGDKFKTWIIPGIQIYGKTLNQDLSFITNRIFDVTTTTTTTTTTIDAPIYINCLNNNGTQTNFSDFIYHAILFGNVNEADQTVSINEYYASCYGNKQMLFNCYKNKNHIPIYTKNPLLSDIMTKQGYYNYKAYHSGSKYAYFDGKSGINYNLAEISTEQKISLLDVTFDVCMPTEISHGNILTDFIGDNSSVSKIYFDENNALSIVLTESITNTETGNIEIQENLYKTDDNIIDVSEYATFRISLQGDSLQAYKNGKQILSMTTHGSINNTPTVLRVAYDKDLSNQFKGFLRNIKLNIIGTDSVNAEAYKLFVDIPLMYTLKDATQAIDYTNYGTRFITVPQLITDTTNLDMYGNKLISLR